jgi:signal transduction histidine kinase
MDIGEATLELIEESRARLQDNDNIIITDSITTGLKVLMDREHWRIILNNLIENSLKYSQDECRIEVKLENNNGKARLEISDNSRGFSKREKKKIFKRFYRVGDEDTRDTQGTGLGLYLVREIVRVFGGEVVADSPGHGQGAIFTITLPLYKN